MLASLPRSCYVRWRYDGQYPGSFWRQAEVFVGGVASNTEVSSGGTAIVFSGGTEIGTKVQSGGTEIVSGGGTISSATVSGGGVSRRIVGGTATLSSAIIAAGGRARQYRGDRDARQRHGRQCRVFVRKRVRQLVARSPVVPWSRAALPWLATVSSISGASKENVRFVASGSGGLDLDVPTAYTGKVLDLVVLATPTVDQFIDLTGVTFSSGVVSETYSGNTTSGVLTVTSGGTTVASIDLIGSYVTSDFHLAAGSGGSGTIITDPQGGQTSATIAAGSVLDINTPEYRPNNLHWLRCHLVLDKQQRSAQRWRGSAPWTASIFHRSPSTPTRRWVIRKTAITPAAR